MLYPYKTRSVNSKKSELWISYQSNESDWLQIEMKIIGAGERPGQVVSP